MFHFSDTLTYLITHSIIQLGMVVEKKISHLKGDMSISNIWYFGSLYISSLCLSLVVIIKRKLIVKVKTGKKIVDSSVVLDLKQRLLNDHF